MILQSLNDYYHRRRADPDPARHLPAFGLEQKEIGFILELDAQGRLRGVTDTRRLVGNKRVGTSHLVPSGVKKTSGIKANLLWDNAEYVLALPDAKKLDAARAKGKADEYVTRLGKMQTEFRTRVEALPNAARDDAGIRAVLSFLASAPDEQARAFSAFGDIASTNPTLTFRLIDGTGELVSQRPNVAPHVVVHGGDEEDETDNDAEDGAIADAMCLVTGTTGPVARLHSAIKGVWGAKASGANIVSFNLNAFSSYGLERGANAPVSRAAAFAYTTALNALLARDSVQRIQVGDASTVFWAQKLDRDFTEEWLCDLMGGDNPDAHVEQVKALYQAVESGAFDGARGENKFYVLALAPNAARAAIRFWHAAPLREFATQIRLWFEDLDIDRGDTDRQYPSLYHLLSRACVPTKDKPLGDISKLPPIIGGQVLAAALTGAPLPAQLLQAALLRIRAEQAKKDEATGKAVRHLPAARAALLKAYLNRRRRAYQRNLKEMTVSLDKTNAEPTYLWGRMFAAYERTQELAADRELNRSIRDAYFGAAMTSPRSVYGRLARLNQVHLRDLKRLRPKAGFHFDRLLLEISDKMKARPEVSFPPRSTPEQQAAFALGYYHQRHEFFARRDPIATGSTSPVPAP